MILCLSLFVAFLTSLVLGSSANAAVHHKMLLWPTMQPPLAPPEPPPPLALFCQFAAAENTSTADSSPRTLTRLALSPHPLRVPTTRSAFSLSSSVALLGFAASLACPAPQPVAPLCPIHTVTITTTTFTTTTTVVKFSPVDAHQQRTTTSARSVLPTTLDIPIVHSANKRRRPAVIAPALRSADLSSTSPSFRREDGDEEEPEGEHAVQRPTSKAANAYVARVYTSTTTTTTTTTIVVSTSTSLLFIER